MGCTPRPRSGARQQAEHARMVPRPARAFVAGRLVEQQQRLLAVRPVAALHAKDEALGRDLVARLVDDAPADLDLPVHDQRVALAPRAEALREQQLRQMHGSGTRKAAPSVARAACVSASGYA